MISVRIRHSCETIGVGHVGLGRTWGRRGGGISCIDRRLSSRCSKIIDHDQDLESGWDERYGLP